MKLLLTVVALAAFAHGAPPASQVMEIGATGLSGSITNIPLVEIIVNMIKGEAVSPGTVNEPVEQAPEPVIVVEQPEVNPIDVIPVNPAPVAPQPTPVDVIDVNPIDVIPVNPAPAPVVPEPNPIDIITVNPAPAPVFPQPTPVDVIEVNPIDIMPINPVPAPVAPQPTPVDVIDVNPIDVAPVNPSPAPAPVDVPEPTPAEIVVPAPESSEGSQIINVMMNFIFGASGSLSSVEVPAGVIPQVIGAPRA